MSNLIKSFSTSQLQDAFSKALSELTGKSCSVEITSIDYNEYNTFLESESISLSLDASIEGIKSKKVF